MWGTVIGTAREREAIRGPIVPAAKDEIITWIEAGEKGPGRVDGI